MSGTAITLCVGIVAPIGADGANVAALLHEVGVKAHVCAESGEAVSLASVPSCGALIFTAEALTADLTENLSDVLRIQPPWSDLPIILITSGLMEGSERVARLRHAGASITILERPLRRFTLAASVRSALAARARQLEVRNLLSERDELLASLERRVAERTAELQKMVEEMEGFSYSVSHDLRSPLRSIAGYAEMLQDDFATELSAPARAYLDRICRAARRMDRLTQDLLAYTRVATGQVEIAPVDLDTLVDEVIDQYPDLAANAGRIEVRKPLGTVLGHGPSLVQCFSNLLGNALKFGRENVPLCIVISSHCAGDRLRIAVRDNGTGVEPADAERIFRMFERAVSKKVPGTGIGLAIVKKAVERMRGAVGLISEPGRGAEFWLELPIPARESPPPHDLTEAAPMAPGRPDSMVLL